MIAVGSPLAGGTGKTPLVAWLAAALRDRAVAQDDDPVCKLADFCEPVRDVDHAHAALAQPADDLEQLRRFAP